MDWGILSGYIKDSAWKYEQELRLRPMLTESRYAGCYKV